MNSPDHTNFVLSMTPTQYRLLTERAAKTLGKALSKALKAPPDTLDQPCYSHPEVTLEKATIRKGAALRNNLYLRLKQLAEANGLSMSKTAIRLLQLPE